MDKMTYRAMADWFISDEYIANTDIENIELAKKQRIHAESHYPKRDKRENIVTIAECCALVKISDPGVRNLIRKGTIWSVKKRKYYPEWNRTPLVLFVDIDEVREHVASRKGTTPQKRESREQLPPGWVPVSELRQELGVLQNTLAVWCRSGVFVGKKYVIGSGFKKRVGLEWCVDRLAAIAIFRERREKNASLKRDPGIAWTDAMRELWQVK